MNKIKFTAALILIILTLYFCPTSLSADDGAFKWQVGEELTYKVEWTVVRLGTVKLQVCDTLTINGKLVYHVKLFLDSNPLLFFVNMHSVFESYIDEQFRVHLFYAEEKIDDITYKTEYRFDYADSLIYVNMTNIDDPAQIISKKIPLDKKLFEGISLIYYSRANVSETKSETVKAFFESKKGDVEINFKGRNGKIEIDALESEVDTYYLDGTLLITGIAGVTGPYKGWFAADNNRTPLKAEMKVFVGNVVIELEEWKKWKAELIK